jgi:hypothetical protein
VRPRMPRRAIATTKRASSPMRKAKVASASQRRGPVLAERRAQTPVGRTPERLCTSGRRDCRPLLA